MLSFQREHSKLCFHPVLLWSKPTIFFSWMIFSQLLFFLFLFLYSYVNLFWLLALWLDGICIQRDEININQPLKCYSASLLKWFEGRVENAGFILIVCRWLEKLGQAFCTRIRQCLTNHIYTPFDPTIPFLGIYHEDILSNTWKSHT